MARKASRRRDEAEAAEVDERRRAALWAQLPGSWDAAVPYYRQLIDRFNAAVLLGADASRYRGEAEPGDSPAQLAASAAKEAADMLARKLHGGVGIRGSYWASLPRLERATASRWPTVPVWGQTGQFPLDLTVPEVPARRRAPALLERHVRIRVAFGGFESGFAVHAMDWDVPFISETGYRSFHGYWGTLAPGTTVDAFVRAAILAYLMDECEGGRLHDIKAEYQKHHRERHVPWPAEESDLHRRLAASRTAQTMRDMAVQLEVEPEPVAEVPFALVGAAAPTTAVQLGLF